MRVPPPDGAEVGDDLARDAEQFLLGAVVIDHEAALEDVRRPGDGADGAGDEAARAAFGGDQAQLALAGLVDQEAGEGLDLDGKHVSTPVWRGPTDLTTGRGAGASPHGR